MTIQSKITFQNAGYEDALREAMLKRAKIDDEIVMRRRSTDNPHARHIKRLPRVAATEHHELQAEAAKRRAKMIPYILKNPGCTRAMMMARFKISKSAMNADIAYLNRKGAIRTVRGRGDGMFSKYYATQKRMAAE